MDVKRFTQCRNRLYCKLHSAILASLPDVDEASESPNFFVRGNRVAARVGDVMVVTTGEESILNCGGRLFRTVEGEPPQKRERLPSDLLADCVRDSIPHLSSLGLSEEMSQDLLDCCDDLSLAIESVDVDRDFLRESTLNGDIDILESCCPIELPPTSSALPDGSGDFGSSELLARQFVLGTSRRRVLYEDKDVSLLAGNREDDSVWSLLLGVDDGGPFFHPMPPSLLFSYEDYQVSRDDIRSVLGYDEELKGGGEGLEYNKWYRVQGDLRIKAVPMSRVAKEKEYLNVRKTVGEIENEELFARSGIPPEVAESCTIGIRPSEEVGFEVKVDFDENRVDREVSKILPSGTTVSGKIKEYLKEVTNMPDNPEQSLKDLLDTQPRNLTAPVDNHVLFVSKGFHVPVNLSVHWTAGQIILEDSLTHFYCSEGSSITVEHAQHDTVTLTNVPEGIYEVSLLHRSPS